jgi:hypothetical protein
MILTTPSRMINSAYISSVEMDRVGYGETPTVVTIRMANGSMFTFAGKEAASVHLGIDALVRESVGNKYSKFKILKCPPLEPEDKPCS